MTKLFCVVTLSVALAGCQTRPPESGWVRSEVYFGLSKSDGSFVTDSEWQAFVNEVVTPRFSAGLSILDAVGQWRNAQGRIEKEHTKMLVLLHPTGAGIEAQIDEIRAAYCRRFNQEAVLKVTSPAEVSFQQGSPLVRR